MYYSENEERTNRMIDADGRPTRGRRGNFHYQLKCSKCGKTETVRYMKNPFYCRVCSVTIKVSGWASRISDLSEEERKMAINFLDHLVALCSRKSIKDFEILPRPKNVQATIIKDPKGDMVELCFEDYSQLALGEKRIRIPLFKKTTTKISREKKERKPYKRRTLSAKTKSEEER